MQERQRLAEQAFKALIEFTDYEKREVPDEFVRTMEALAETIAVPTFFLFHNENGRWQTPDERAFYLQRMTAIYYVADNLSSRELNKVKP